MSKSRGNQPNLLPGVDPEIDCQAAEESISGDIGGAAAADSEGEEQNHDHAHNFSWDDLEGEANSGVTTLAAWAPARAGWLQIFGAHRFGD